MIGLVLGDGPRTLLQLAAVLATVGPLVALCVYGHWVEGPKQ